MPANETLDNVNPYDGFGAITAAAQIVCDSVSLIVAVTDAKTRLPPGDVVVSTSTTVELAVSGRQVCEGDGVVNGVPEMDGVPEGVPDGDGEFDLVPVCDGEFDLVPEPDPVGDKVGVGVPLGSAPADGVPVCDGDGLGDAATTPWMKKGEP